MKVNGTNLYMTRGDSESISVTISGYDIQPGDILEMTVRRSLSSRVSIHKKITEFFENKAVISILPNDTSGLPVGEYVYDIQLTFGDAVKTIVTPSKFVIGAEVTYG